MKRSYLYLLVFVVAVVALVIVFTNKPQEEAQAVLRVGTDAAYEPFEYIDEDGNFAGFDMELIAMIAEEMGRELELQNVNGTGSSPG